MLKKNVLFAMSVLLPSLTTAQSSGSSASSSRGSASSTSSSASSSASSTSVPKIWRVNVGAFGSHAFDPDTTFAAVGDIVQFVFYPTNHSVIRGEYTGSDACGAGGCNPCIPWEIIHPDQKEKAFHSDNQMTQFVLPVNAAVNGSAKVWNYTVESTDPVFYYCNALGSCTPNGMIGVINPTELVDWKKQKEAAKKAPYQLAPGEAWPAEGATPGAETATIPGYSQTTSTSTPPANSTGGTSGHHSLSGGAIAGIVIGGVAILVLAAALFYFMGRSKTYKDMFKANQSAHSETAGTASQAGDGLGAWTPAPPMGGSAVRPNRQSYMTQYSQTPSDATFVGYNRQTGAPEFATEAPIAEHGQYQYHSAHGTPQPQQGAFPPQSAFPQNKRETFELPASTPDIPRAHERP